MGLLELHCSFGVGLFCIVEVLQCSGGGGEGGATLILSSEEPDVL